MHTLAIAILKSSFHSEFRSCDACLENQETTNKRSKTIKNKRSFDAYLSVKDDGGADEELLRQRFDFGHSCGSDEAV